VRDGQVEQHHVAGRALDQRPDRGFVHRAGDEIALPVPGNGPVLDFGGTLTDIDHAGDPAAALRRFAARLAQRPARAQARGQLSSQRPATLDIQGLVDRLVRHAHLRVVQEIDHQPPADLLRTVLGEQLPLDMLAQLPCRASNAAFGRRARVSAPACATEAR
jgi:hypothetical protein